MFDFTFVSLDALTKAKAKIEEKEKERQCVTERESESEQCESPRFLARPHTYMFEFLR